VTYIAILEMQGMQPSRAHDGKCGDDSGLSLLC
jgi:hypothetical protein